MGKLLGKQHVRGLRSRWLRSGVLLTVAVVVLAVSVAVVRAGKKGGNDT